MPQSPPKNKNKDTKYHQFEDSSGWTHVVRGPRLPSTEIPGRSSDVEKHMFDHFSACNRPSYQTLLARYKAAKSKWRASTASMAFRALFEEKILPREDIQITEAMCVGMGSLSTDRGTADRSMGELVAFEEWVEILKSKYPIQNIYIQDPALTWHDASFLQTLATAGYFPGVTVIKHPAATTLLKPTTFLFAHCLPIFYHVAFLGVAQPSLYISNDIHASLETSMWPNARVLKEDLWEADLKAFFTGRASWRLEGDGEMKRDSRWGWVDRVKVYWERREGDGGDGAVESFYADACKIGVKTNDDDEADMDERTRETMQGLIGREPDPDRLTKSEQREICKKLERDWERLGLSLKERQSEQRETWEKLECLAESLGHSTEELQDLLYRKKTS